jgi:hypothetical protein
MKTKQYDTRWIIFPTSCLLSIVIGDISLWIILPILIGCFPIYIKIK